MTTLVQQKAVIEKEIFALEANRDAVRDDVEVLQMQRNHLETECARLQLQTRPTNSDRRSRLTSAATKTSVQDEDLHRNRFITQKYSATGNSDDGITSRAASRNTQEHDARSISPRTTERDPALGTSLAFSDLEIEDETVDASDGPTTPFLSNPAYPGQDLGPFVQDNSLKRGRNPHSPVEKLAELGHGMGKRIKKATFDMGRMVGAFTERLLDAVGSPEQSPGETPSQKTTNFGTASWRASRSQQVSGRAGASEQLRKAPSSKRTTPARATPRIADQTKPVTRSMARSSKHSGKQLGPSSAAPGRNFPSQPAEDVVFCRLRRAAGQLEDESKYSHFGRSAHGTPAIEMVVQDISRWDGSAPIDEKGSVVQILDREGAKVWKCGTDQVCLRQFCEGNGRDERVPRPGNDQRQIQACRDCIRDNGICFVRGTSLGRIVMLPLPENMRVEVESKSLGYWVKDEGAFGQPHGQHGIKQPI